MKRPVAWRLPLHWRGQWSRAYLSIEEASGSGFTSPLKSPVAQGLPLHWRGQWFRDYLSIEEASGLGITSPLKRPLVQGLPLHWRGRWLRVYLPIYCRMERRGERESNAPNGINISNTNLGLTSITFILATLPAAALLLFTPEWG